MTNRRFLNLLLLVSMVASLLLAGGGPVAAQDPVPPGGNNPKMEQLKAMAEPMPAGGNGHGNGKMRSMTLAERKAARLGQPPQQKGVSQQYAGVSPATAARSPLTSAAPDLATMAAPLAQPDFYAVANWANSPLPTIDPVTGGVTGGMRKFVDTLPPLCPTKNDLLQCLPIAVADTSTFPGSDYYEIELGQYTEQLHADLPATTLRGYRQTNTTDPNASHFNYLGPIILAQRNRPVRVKFTNSLSAGAGGDLFIPTDTTYMGAGNGPDGTPYTQNRATLHLHGGNTPWISDGTPHQWTAPAAELTTNKKGVSVAYVPDMWFTSAGTLIPSCAGQPTCGVAGATNNPGAGKLTFYWTNQETGRLMFYHDHAYGITRLNVYAGEAAGYLLADPAQENALAAATVPGTVGATPDLAHLVPLVIQDKTFVPDNGVAGGQLAATDPTWSVARYGGKGNLWFPHVYTPNQNPADITGANAYGRWDYGPWFWPPQNPATLVSQPYACSSAAYTAASPPAFPPLMCPGIPNPSGVPEGFLDTPVINGTAYPSLTVDPAAYRLQILSAGNDRTWNLGLYVAEPLSIGVTNGGSGYSAAPTVYFTGGAGGGTGAAATATMSTGSVTAILVTGVGSGYTSTPNVTITGDGTSAAATAVIDPTLGQVLAVNVSNIGTGYTYANVAIDPPAGCTTGCVTATAAATVTPSGVIIGVTVTNPGSAPWTAAPTVNFTGGGGFGAAAIASVNAEVKMVPADPPTPASALKLCTTATATSGAMLALAALDGSGNPLNGTGLPANCWPTSWPTDGREGGVPDPTTAGPPIIQIGTEGGLLPSAVAIPSTPTNFEYNRRSITVLNIFTHGLLVGPAERADVVVDFTHFAGKTLLLYNDAPAPVPAFDPRNDYYTGSPDQTLSGGAPTTLPGYGPNTRTIMQIKVNATGTPGSFSLPALSTALPNIFAATQDPIIVAEPAYPAANGGGGPTYVRIEDTTLPGLLRSGGAIGGLTLTNGGSGYTAAPTVGFTGGGGANAAATATLATTANVYTLTLTNGGYNYSSAPTVAITGGGGANAAATATLAARGVTRITVTSGGRRYTSAPTVGFTGGGGGGAAAVATILNGAVTKITVTSAGTAYTSAPTVTFTGGGGSGASAIATLAPAAVVSLTLTNRGSGFTSVPAVGFSGGGGSGAAATATLGFAVASLTLTNGGAGYTSLPSVTFTNAAGDTTGAGAAATASAAATPLLPKAIQELFTLDYGRMNATLGVEIPKTNFQTQTTIPYGYIDPPTEIFKDGETQIWKITHNGVDTHFIHFHLFTVQVINRVGWDGAIKPPDINELSWKDTVRMNPLEDIIVALKPMKQQKIAATDLDVSNLPNSIRPLDVTLPVGSLTGFTNVDPTGEPATVVNDMTNFGWEYVWHCHILGHEENDMMRAMILAVPPLAPSGLTATLGGPIANPHVVLNWADNSHNETGFSIERATGAGPWTPLTTVGVNVTTFTDTTVVRRTTYHYRVIANNVVGYTRQYAAPAAGYPSTSADSAPSGTASVTTR